MGSLQIDLTDLPLPIVLRPAAPVSDEELLRFSAQNRPLKIERNKEGDLTIMTPVGGIGSTHENYVSSKLFLWAEQDGAGIAFGSNAGFDLPDGACLSPDAAWLRADRWHALTPAQQESYPPLCPDFIIEVRSRSDARRIVEAKMQTWIDNGAKLAWLIDPIDANVAIYRPGHAPETLERPDVVKAETPIDGFELHCVRLWSAG